MLNAGAPVPHRHQAKPLTGTNILTRTHKPVRLHRRFNNTARCHDNDIDIECEHNDDAIAADCHSIQLYYNWIDEPTTFDVIISNSKLRVTDDPLRRQSDSKRGERGMKGTLNRGSFFKNSRKPVKEENEEEKKRKEGSMQHHRDPHLGAPHIGAPRSMQHHRDPSELIPPWLLKSHEKQKVKSSLSNLPVDVIAHQVVNRLILEHITTVGRCMLVSQEWHEV